MTSTLMHNMVASYKRTVAPTLLPVTVDELKDELDILDDTSMDARLTDLLWEATERVETDTNRLIMSQTWQMYLDRFPCDEIVIRKVPISAVSFVKYVTGGVLTTFSSASYQTDLISEPCRIDPVSGSAWPSTDSGYMNAVLVEFVAGYASASVVPRNVKSAVKYAAKQAYYGCDAGENYLPLVNRLRYDGWVT